MVRKMRFLFPKSCESWFCRTCQKTIEIVVPHWINYYYFLVILNVVGSNFVSWWIVDCSGLVRDGISSTNGLKHVRVIFYRRFATRVWRARKRKTRIHEGWMKRRVKEREREVMREGNKGWAREGTWWGYKEASRGVSSGRFQSELAGGAFLDRLRPFFRRESFYIFQQHERMVDGKRNFFFMLPSLLELSIPCPHLFASGRSFYFAPDVASLSSLSQSHFFFFQRAFRSSASRIFPFLADRSYEFRKNRYPRIYISRMSAQLRSNFSPLRKTFIIAFPEILYSGISSSSIMHL